MNYSLREQRLLGKTYSQGDKSLPGEMQEGDPGFAFGDVPIGSTITGIGVDRTDNMIKTGPHSAEKTWHTNGVIDGRFSRDSIESTAPIGTVILPTQKEMRQRYEEALRPDRHSMHQIPLALNQMFYAVGMYDAERSQTGPAQGPAHNPYDRMREWMNFDAMPNGSFFTFDRNPTPDSDSQVWLKNIDDYCLPICTFEEWFRGSKDISVDLKKNKSHPEFQGSGVLLLHAMSTEDWDRDMAIMEKQRAEEKLPTDTAYLNEQREKIAQFWEQRKEKAQ